MTASRAAAGNCVFCKIIAAGDYDDESDGVVSFEPLNPVSPGHRLIVPVAHVTDALEDAGITARAATYAVEVANKRGLRPCNIMTSVGTEATQSVFHLHIHIVPRRRGDGLMLPWTEQQAKAAGPLA